MEKNPFRFDRFITLNLVHPVTRLAGIKKKGAIPILMYHSISDGPEKRVHPYYRTNTAPKIFKEQMKYFFEHNYAVVTLKDLINPMGSADQPNKTVVITFDDGYRDFYANAYPVLSKYGFSATVFLPTGFIDENSKNLKGIKNTEHLSWKEVRELNSNNMDFGSHTVNHPKLAFLSEEKLEYELSYSKKTIEDKLGEAVSSFSYPFAFPEENNLFKNKLVDILKKCEYKNGVSTRIGTSSKTDELFFMRRLPINSCDDNNFMSAKLEGSYNWLGKPQYYYKMLKSLKKR